jgi:hypothetical protein
MASAEQPGEPDRPRSELVRFVLLTWPACILWMLALTSPFWVSLEVEAVWRIGGKVLSMFCVLCAFVALNKRDRRGLRVAAMVFNFTFLLPWMGVNLVGQRQFVSGGSLARTMCKQYYDDAYAWRLETGAWPESLATMEAPLRPGYEDFTIIVSDPWGNPYELEANRDGVHVRSRGVDGQKGTPDDICYPPMDADEEERR